jgi:hypothetical protein
MKTVENGYRYDDRLRCTGKRRNNLLNDGRLRLPFTVAVYVSPERLAGTVIVYCRLLPFFALFHLFVRISYYVSQNYLKHIYDCFLMKSIQEINLFIKLQQLLF